MKLLSAWSAIAGIVRFTLLAVGGAAAAWLLGAPWEIVLPALVAILATPTLMAASQARAILRFGMGANGPTVVGVLPKWPIAPERIVANELAEARTLAEQSAKLAQKLASPGTSSFLAPTKARHAEQLEKYLAGLDSYGRELEAWLVEYDAKREIRTHTFALKATILNASRDGLADGVRLILEFEEGISVADEVPRIELPPLAPAYEPPKSLSDLNALGLTASGYRGVSFSAPRITFPNVGKPAWTVSVDGRSARYDIGQLHPGESFTLSEEILLSVSDSGPHIVKWSLSTANGGKRRSGVTRLQASSNGDQPALGRLYGVVKYPDLDLTSDDGEVESAARTTDPPLEPAACKSEEVIDRIRSARDRTDWRSLGLRERDDGPRDSAWDKL